MKNDELLPSGNEENELKPCPFCGCEAHDDGGGSCMVPNCPLSAICNRIPTVEEWNNAWAHKPIDTLRRSLTNAFEFNLESEKKIIGLEKRNAELEKRFDALQQYNITMRQLLNELEKCNEELAQRNKILEESKTTQTMLDEVKKLHDEWKEKAEAYRELAAEFHLNGTTSGSQFAKGMTGSFELVDAEAARIMEEKHNEK